MPVVSRNRRWNGVPAMASQLTVLEREQIAQFRSQRLSKAEIGRRLGRHRATIGRELMRNSDGASYWASSAHQKAQARRQHRPGKLDDAELNDYMRRGLVQRWSPEQIAGRSRRDFRCQPRRWLSHSTIYRGIANDAYRQHWESFLRFGRRRRQPETRGKLPARAEIAGRPAAVEARKMTVQTALGRVGILFQCQARSALTVTAAAPTIELT